MENYWKAVPLRFLQSAPQRLTNFASNCMMWSSLLAALLLCRSHKSACTSASSLETCLPASACLCVWTRWIADDSPRWQLQITAWQIVPRVFPRYVFKKKKKNSENACVSVPLPVLPLNTTRTITNISGFLLLQRLLKGICLIGPNAITRTANVWLRA